MIEFPTNLATIVGRWACDGPADLEAVRALQRGLGLEPSGTSRPATGLPVPAAVPDELAFFERLRTWMQAFPPSAQDQEYQQRFAADGSLTIVIQHQPPPDTSNWLPAPAAPFRPLMRLYQPQPAILDGTYTIPPITKAS